MTSPALTRETPRDGGPFLFVLTLVVMVSALGIGTAAGLGKAAVLGAMVGLFGVLITFTGSLGPDLRRMAWLGPAIVVAACVPRAVSNQNGLAGVLVLVVVIFAVSLLPSISPRFKTVTIGASYCAVAGYGIALPDGTPETHIIAAVVLGLAIAVLIRVLIGFSDPTGPTRAVLVTPLRTGEFDTVEVIRTWMVDRPDSWTTTLLTESLRYRRGITLLTALAAQSATTETERAHITSAIAALDHHANAIADVVTARKPADDLAAIEVLPADIVPEDGVSGSAHALITSAAGHLVTLAAATGDRRGTPLPQIRALRTTFLRARLSAALSPDSVDLQQGLAKSVGMFAAWGTGLQVSQPAFANTFFNAVVSMLQPTWTETLRRIGYRLLGCAMAIVIVVAAAIWLPPVTMVVVALAGLFALTWFMFSHPIVSNAGGVAMTVALTSTTRHLDPVNTLTHVVWMLLVAGVIVVLVSLPAVLRARHTTPADSLTTALGRVVDLLAQIESGDADDVSSRFGIFVRGSQISDRLRGTAAAMSPDEREQIDRAADIIDMLMLVTVIYREDSDGPDSFHDAIAQARGLLAGSANGPDELVVTEGSDVRIVVCARELLRVKAVVAER